MAQDRCFHVSILDASSCDPDLFLQDQTSLGDDNFFNDGDDSHSVFLADLGHRCYDAPDRHSLDIDPLVGHRLVDLVLDL